MPATVYQNGPEEYEELRYGGPDQMPRVRPGGFAGYPSSQRPGAPPPRGGKMPQTPVEEAAVGGRTPKNFRERKRVVMDGVEYIRDGSRMFPAAAVEAAGGDFNAIDPSLSRSWREGKAKERQATAAAYNDRAWTPFAQEAGYKDWREMRRVLMTTPEFQNASPEDQFYILRGGPGVWQQYGGVGNKASLPPVLPQAPVDPNVRPPQVPTDREDAGPIYSNVPIQPKPQPTNRPQIQPQTRPRPMLPPPPPPPQPVDTTKPIQPPAGMQFPGAVKAPKMPGAPKLSGIF